MLRLALLLLAALPLAAQTYPLTANSMRQEGVPEGRIEHFEHKSEIYPGTVRDVWVYIPAQYDGADPAAVMVFQDGRSFINTEGERAWMTPVVLDNLIHKGRMPVTVGVFVHHGVLPALREGHRERYNRSFEYDALGDRYVSLLLEEVLPAVAERYELKLTDDPNLRGIGGSSSGAIAAFNAAWERPDEFRRVLSFVGSYVNLRGAQILESLVRKHEPRPLKVFMQDGRADLNIYSGSWWMANQALAEALEFAGYDSRFIIGSEGHNNVHGRAILPDALAWLWSDWEQPIERNRKKTGDRQWVQDFLDPQEDWEQVSEGHNFTEGPALAPNGDVYFTDVRGSKIHKIDGRTGRVSLFMDDSGRANGLMFGADGLLYICRNEPAQIVAVNVETMEEKVITEGVPSNDIMVMASGDIYFTSPTEKQVWYKPTDGEARVVFEDQRLGFLNGVIASPDQSLLMVNDSRDRWVWSFQIQPDGSLGNGQAFYRLETPDGTYRSSADGMAIGAEGHLFVATAEGIQICDQPGRVIGIIGKPQPGSLSNLVFAGPDLKTIYATARDKVYKRRVRAQGVRPWETRKPPRPGL